MSYFALRLERHGLYSCRILIKIDKRELDLYLDGMVDCFLTKTKEIVLMQIMFNNYKQKRAVI